MPSPHSSLEDSQTHLTAPTQRPPARARTYLPTYLPPSGVQCDQDPAHDILAVSVRDIAISPYTARPRGGGEGVARGVCVCVEGCHCPCSPLPSLQPIKATHLHLLGVLSYGSTYHPSTISQTTPVSSLPCSEEAGLWGFCTC